MNPRLWREEADGSFARAPVFEKGGGGGGAGMMMMMMMQQQQQQAAREAADRMRQEQREEAEKKEKEALKLEERNRFTGDLERLSSGAREYGSGKIGELFGGEDRYGLGSALEREITAKRGLVPDLTKDVGAYINPETMWNKVYEEKRGSERQKLGRSADEFMGTGFEKNLFKDTSDDTLLDAILGEQHAEASQVLQRSRDRGQISDTGYNYALNELAKQRSQGRSKLEDLGLGVLDTYRSGLTNTAKGYRDRINNFDLTDTIDTNAFRTGLEGEASGYRNRMEGDIRAALGDTNYFDTNLILGKAGNYQGANNNSLIGASPTTPLTQAFAGVNAEDDPMKKRTASTVGVF